MANLGAIGWGTYKRHTNNFDGLGVTGRKFCGGVYEHSMYPIIATPSSSGTVSGNVKEGVTNLQDVKVLMIDRTYPRVVYHALTDISGNYTMTRIPAGSYTMIFLDPAGGVVYEDLINGYFTVP